MRLPLVLAALALVTGCQAGTTTASAVRPLPSLSPAGRAVAPVAQLAAVPRPGTVTVRQGPFSDRFRLTATTLYGGTVRTRLAVTSDVSELITLTVQAAFYDARGVLLGTGSTDYAEGDGASGEHATAENGGVALAVAAPAAVRARVASAVLSVPVLVNE